MTAEKRMVFETRSLATPDKQGLAAVKSFSALVHVLVYILLQAKSQAISCPDSRVCPDRKASASARGHATQENPNPQSK